RADENGTRVRALCEYGARRMRGDRRFHYGAARHERCFASTVPSEREQDRARKAMRYYILIPWLLASLAGACTPESIAAPNLNEGASAGAAGSLPPLLVKQIEQIIGVHKILLGPDRPRTR